MEIKIDVEDLSAVRKKLKVEIPQEETKKAYDEVAKKIASLARIPGFRPGKAPMGLIRSRYRNEIKDKLIQDLLPRSYDEALKVKNLKPLAAPQIERLDFQVGAPLTYEAVFEVRPEFELAEYKGLPLQKKVAPVTDADVDSVLNRLREDMAKFVPVQDRPSLSGDQLTVDIEGAYLDGETGEPSPQQSLKEEAVSLTLDEKNTLPEFNDSLKGAAVGERREFVVRYPEEFGRKELAGKSIRYWVTVRAIKEKKLPDLDDEFVKELGQEFETLEQVRKKVLEDLEHNRRHETEDSLQEQAIDRLIEHNQFEVPGVLIEERVQQKMQRFAYEIARRGAAASRSGVDWEKVREELRRPSEREVRAALILERIAGAEGVAPTEDEVDQELERIAKAQGQSIEKVALEYEKENRMVELRDRLATRRAIALVVEQARVQEVQEVEVAS